MSLPACAEQLIVARAAGERVVAVAAEQVARRAARRWLRRARWCRCRLAEHLDHGRIGDGRCAAIDRNGAAVDENLSGRIATGRDGVVETVSDTESKPAPGENVALIAMVIVLSNVSRSADAH